MQQYLHPSTEPDLINKCEKVLIEKHVETIWNEFQHLLEDDKIDDLTRMYTLLSRIPRGLEPLRTTLEKHVQNVGLQAVQTNGSTAINVSNSTSLSPFNCSYTCIRIPSYMWRHSFEYSRNTTT